MPQANGLLEKFSFTGDTLMNMIKTSLAAIIAAGVLAGCASSDATKDKAAGAKKADAKAAAAVAGPMPEGFMTACNNPDAAGGPLGDNVLYVVGTFPDSSWIHKDHRTFSYKGHNVYQAVIDEKSGLFKFQFAARNWSPQFTLEGKTMDVGVEKKLNKGGYQKDTKVKIETAGKYVWSMKLNDKGKPQSAVVAPCK